MTTTYTAVFVVQAHAEAFEARITDDEDGFWVTNVSRKGRTVTFEPNAKAQATPAWEYDIRETVGFYGSPPVGPVATLNGVRTPRSY